MFKLFSLILVSMSFVPSVVCMEQDNKYAKTRMQANENFKKLVNPDVDPHEFLMARPMAKWFYEKANNQILNDFEHKDRKNSNDQIKYE